MTNPTTVLSLRGGVVLREEEDRILLFNPGTDEMHLVPKCAYPLLQLCRGAFSFGEVVELARGPRGTGDTTEADLRPFFDALIERGLVDEVPALTLPTTPG